MIEPIAEHDAWEFRVQRREPGLMFEFQAFSLPLNIPIGNMLPATPGAVLRHDAGSPAAMHVGPGRWLAPDPGADLLEMFDSAVAAHAGMLTEVTGKWQLFEITGPGAIEFLRGTVAIESVLAGRGCAALPLFDCPALVVSEPDGYVIWVAASYATTLAARLRIQG